MKTVASSTQTQAESSTGSSNPSLVQSSLLQRKCACGGSAGPEGECAGCQKKRIGLQTKLQINEPGDVHEQEADRVADAVVRGGNVATPAAQSSLSVQRKDPGAIAAPKAEEKSDEDKYKEAAEKIGEAFLESKEGQALKDSALKVGEKFVETVEGKVIAGTALGGALTAIIASNSELPVPIPEIPLDFISEGLKAKVTYEGPVQNPTNVSLVLTTAGGVSAGGYYKYAEATDSKPEEYQAGLTVGIPLGPTAEPKPGPTEKEKFRAETARMALSQQQFRDSMKTPEQRAAEDQAWMSYVLYNKNSALSGLTQPSADWDPAAEQKKKKKKKATVQRKAASTGHAGAQAPGAVQETLQSSGSPLDAASRSFMESRFGHDFGHVRIHADGQAARSAQSVNALAYTVGNHVVFDPGNWSPHTTEGRRLLAHELTHVIQQGAGSPKSVQRKPGVGVSFPSAVPSRKLPERQLNGPRLRRVDAVDADGFPVTAETCDCIDTVNIMEERIHRSMDAFKSCYKPGMLVGRLYHCAKQQLYTPYVGAENAMGVPSAASTSSSSGAITWPENDEVKTRMNALGHRQPCWPLVFESVHRHEKKHVADFDEVAQDVGPEFFEAFKKLEGDEDRLDKLRSKGFEKEAALYESRAVNTFQMGPARAVEMELNSYEVELKFIAKLRAALSQVCKRKRPVPRQPDVGRPTPERPDQPPLWPTILEDQMDTDSGDDAALQRKARNDGERQAVNPGALTRSPSPISVVTRTVSHRLQRAWHSPAPGTCDDIARGVTLDRVIVEQETPQSVTLIWSDGTVESMPTSTGKGHCCVDPKDKDGVGCTQDESVRDGSNCTAINTGDGHAITERKKEHNGWKFWNTFVAARGIALHQHHSVTGKPLSHGCVRVQEDTARKVFCGAVQNKTRVEVRGYARPRCNDPDLIYEWQADFGGARARDGEPNTITSSMREHRRMLRESYGRELTSQELKNGPINLGIPKCGDTAAQPEGEERQLMPDLTRKTPAETTSAGDELEDPFAEDTNLAATKPAGREVLARQGFSAHLPRLTNSLRAARSFTSARMVVRQRGQLLWRAARSRTQQQTPNTDDRSLYYTRLEGTRLIRQWAPRFALTNAERTDLIQVYEDASRGIDDITFRGARRGEKRILVSGFDPFGVGNPIGFRGNPSGAIALTLDGTPISEDGVNARIEGVIFPVRFRDFNAGMVERVFRQYLTGENQVDMIMTISQGGSTSYEIEEHAGRRRSSGAADNEGQFSGSPTNLIEPPGIGPGSEFLPTTLPKNEMRAAMGRTNPLQLESEVIEIPRGQTQAVHNPSSGPTPGSTAVRGSGGGYLSNEIMYRTLRMRTETGATIPVGHLHVPVLQDPGQFTTAAFAQQRDAMVVQVRDLLKASLKTLT